MYNKSFSKYCNGVFFTWKTGLFYISTDDALFASETVLHISLSSESSYKFLFSIDGQSFGLCYRFTYVQAM